MNLNLTVLNSSNCVPRTYHYSEQRVCFANLPQENIAFMRRIYSLKLHIRT